MRASNQGFFNIPVDNLFRPRRCCWTTSVEELQNLTLVSRAGGVERTRAFAKRLNAILAAIIDKRREKANVAQVMHIIGDVTTMTASCSTTWWTPRAR